MRAASCLAIMKKYKASIAKLEEDIIGNNTL